jgi:PAS domain S-box-containing protein
VLRDVSLELGALGRLVDQLGASLFRVRVADGAVELVSPAIVRLTGLDAATCTQHPVLLTALISAEERERVVFLYRRMARGEIPVASAQVSLRRADGAVRLLQIRATCRRDTSGVVRHIDGVVSDAARESESIRPDGGAYEGSSRFHGSAFDGALRSAVSAVSPASGLPRDPLARASMELSHELLREASQHLHTLGRELRSVRAALKANAGSLPTAAVEDLLTRLEGAAAGAAGTAALNRSVRRVLTAATSLGAPLGEVLESVLATLTPVLGGERVIVVDAGDAASAVVPERVEELGAALVYLALRAFRFAGSGTLCISASRSEPTRSSDPSYLSDVSLPSARARRSRPPPERRYVVIEIVGTAPADLAESALEISSDMLRIPRPTEADLAYQAAHTLIAAVGGSIETDDTTFTTARSVVRLRV